jgi:hypothetical protein
MVAKPEEIKKSSSGSETLELINIKKRLKS